MSSSKFKAEPKRVVCQCQSSGCYKGLYLDASGVSQHGVEVLPSTKEAHERADQRNHIHQSLASHHATTSSQTPTTESQLDSLIAPLDRLLLGPQHEIRSRNNFINTREHQVLSTTEDRDRTVTDQEKSDIVDASHCTAIAVAREKGAQEYDCSRFHSFTLAKFNPVCLHVALTAAIMTIFDHSFNVNLCLALKI
ncbi:uncharacterized protein MELLADRAFT_70015 [Melampsora larici-populina 98AG31]|uniref:Uncharacterized protein n=1 Tax=Melampsora larici-populina (strain 98AG31 / pathotype 3-4-7) TaxID=747676 RepID=F4SD64_MELLP|nr:uncharacterized protein MELLADRAFT_70015 [Melampsora larici-populina 98AG31]EGF97412.1 hypothetical protein MELLADRAFT_70015 [Melampsora larici-populina 98AG31]